MENIQIYPVTEQTSSYTEFADNKQRNKCSKCNKLYLQTTLNKYDGSQCKRCFDKPTTVDTKKEYVKKTIPKKLRKEVWLARVGDRVKGNCYICNDKIDSFTFDCAHIVAEAYEGEMSVENMHVTCSTCNKSCGKMNLNEYKKLFPKDFYKKKINYQLIIMIINLLLLIVILLLNVF